MVSLYTQWVLGAITLAHISYIASQFILAYVKDQAASDIGFTDAQYGLLVGYAFTLVFVVVGVPVGYVSDVHSRKAVIVGSIFTWSVATVAQGMAATFPQLLLARMLLGVGSAGFNAASLALIADYFAADSRSLANSVFSTSVYMGGGITAAIGSILADSDFGWRWTVASFGIAGAGLALLVALTVREKRPDAQPTTSQPSSSSPRPYGGSRVTHQGSHQGSENEIEVEVDVVGLVPEERRSEGKQDQKQQPTRRDSSDLESYSNSNSSGSTGSPPQDAEDERVVDRPDSMALLHHVSPATPPTTLGARIKSALSRYGRILVHMTSLQAMTRLVVASGVRIMGGLIFGSFVPSFFKNTYPSYPNATAIGYGLVVLLVGTSASMLGGYLTKISQARSIRSPLYVAAAGPVLAIPCVIVLVLARDIMGSEKAGLVLAFVALVFSYLFAEVWLGPVFMTIQALLPVYQRGGGLALFFAGCAFLDGAGPIIVGLFLDGFAKRPDSSEPDLEYHTSSAKYIIGGGIVTCYALSAFGFVLASSTYPSDIEKVAAIEATGIPLKSWSTMSSSRKYAHYFGAFITLAWVSSVITLSLTR